MAEFIDEKFWRESLAEPDWYLRLVDDFKRLEKLAKEESDPARHKAIKHEAYAAVESALRENRIPLAKTNYGLGKDRQPIDTVVIHHTNNPPGLTLEQLNAMQLLRVYGMYFADPTDPDETYLKGKPVGSDHFYEDKQVFWVYHWIVRADGSAERILDDKNIGWHANDWDINKRSVAICVDDDLTEKQPGETVIQSIADVLRNNYGSVSPDNILGHCDVDKHTECPGYLFRESWRRKLIIK